MSLARRHFNTLAAFGLLATQATWMTKALAAAGAVQSIMFKANDWVPNNPTLPVLIYPGALPISGSDPAALFEKTFSFNGWPPQWRYGVFNFHHYHTEGHEVLGVFAGSAQLMLGGPGGQVVEVKAGDVLLLPVGTGHCNMGSSPDFEVVGAYPPGQQGDINRIGTSPLQLKAMAALPFPDRDPVQGADGALSKYWHHA